MIPKHFILFTLCSSLLLAEARDDFRTFTSTDGSQIEAKITDSADADSVTIERRDGRSFKDVAIVMFSEEDREYILRWQKREEAKYDDADLKLDSRITINVLKSKSDAFNDYGDIDDRVVSFSPGVIVDNKEIRYGFEKVSGSLIIVGKNIMDKDQYVILSRQDFKINLPKKEKTRWEGKPFKCRYDPDYGGYDYEGYLVVLRNKKGEIVQEKASKTVWEKNAKSLIKAKQRRGYSRDFKQSTKLYSTYGLY